MITIETLCVRLERTTPLEVEDWVSRRWLRPEGVSGHYLFHPIDEARARLILELRHDLSLHEDALPLVLSLLDQLYAARRQVRRVQAALHRHPDPELRRRLSLLLDEVAG